MKISEPARNLQQALFPVVEMLAAMAVAQAVAAIQVHLSNRALLATVQAAAAAGYLPVPNRRLWPELAGLESAFHGGVFFTLSAGAGLGLLAALAGASSAVFRLRLAPMLVAWAGLLLFMNAEGFAPFATLYALLVPPVAFGLGRRGFREGDKAAWNEVLLTRLLPIALLALAWFSQNDREIFTAIRDRLLLSNPVGEAVHDYYYRWTLYPAEAFKSPAQKQLRTVWLRSDPAAGDSAAVAAALAGCDVLPLAGAAGAQFEAEAAGGVLRFGRPGGGLLAQTTIAAFLAAPEAFLQEAFQAADRQAPFRRFVFAAFLLGFPTTLYLVAFGFARLQAAVFLPLGGRAAGAFAALLCFALAVWLFAFFVREGRDPEAPPAGQAAERLSPPVPQGAQALRALLARGRDLTAIPGWEKLAHSPDPRVRGLLARGLAVSPSPSAAPVLERLLADPQLHVRTAAIEALARRGGRFSRERLPAVLEHSPFWYEQFYAYRALRSLGWKQAAGS